MDKTINLALKNYFSNSNSNEQLEPTEYKSFSTVAMQHDVERTSLYSYKDVYEYEAAVSTLFLIERKLSGKYYYHGLSTINDYLHSCCDISAVLKSYSDISSKNRSLFLLENHYVYEKMSYVDLSLSTYRITSSVEMHINKFLNSTISEHLGVEKSIQRNDSEKAGHRYTPRFRIPAKSITSTLLFFRYYDGRNFDNQKGQVDPDRLPRYSAKSSYSVASYLSAVNMLLLECLKNPLEDNIYFLLDANRVLHFFDIMAMNHYIDYLTSPAFLNRFINTCNTTYEEVVSLKKNLINSITSPDLLNMIFSENGYMIIEYICTYLQFHTIYRIKPHSPSELIKEAKQFAISAFESKQVYFDSYDEVFRKIKISKDGNIKNVSSALFDLNKLINENKYFKSLCTLQPQTEDQLFKYISYDIFFKYIVN